MSEEQIRGVEPQYGHWDISGIGPFDPDSFFGFIYEIEELDTGRLYVGRKQFRKKNKKEMKWREYESSSAELVTLIAMRGKDAFAFRILILCSGKSQLTYEEERMQYGRNVLLERMPNGERRFFNKTIGHRHFAGVEKQTEAARQKMSVARKGILLTEEHKKKIGAANRACGIETRIKQSAAAIIRSTPEYRAKIAKANSEREISEATHSKLSAALVKARGCRQYKPLSPETRAKISASLKAKK